MEKEYNIIGNAQAIGNKHYINKKQLNRLQSIELDILVQFISFCNINKLSYYLMFGSLLGCIRHKGFIPWDDDIDICMPQEDYKHLLRTFVNNDSRYGLSSFHITFSPFDSLHAKIVDTRHTVVRVIGKHIVEEHAWIDVFSIDGLPNIKINRALHVSNIRALSNLHDIAKIATIGVDKTKLDTWLKTFTAFFANSKCFSALFNQENRLKALQKALWKYPYCDDQYSICFSRTIQERAIFKPYWFKHGRTAEFCGIQMRIPYEAEKVLSQIYGEYSSIPSEEKRTASHIVRLNTDVQT